MTHNRPPAILFVSPVKPELSIMRGSLNINFFTPPQTPLFNDKHENSFFFLLRNLALLLWLLLLDALLPAGSGDGGLGCFVEDDVGLGAGVDVILHLLGQD